MTGSEIDGSRGFKSGPLQQRVTANHCDHCAGRNGGAKPERSNYTVHEQVRDKLPFDYEGRGEQAVKNIARPVRVWRVALLWSPSSGVIATEYRSPLDGGSGAQTVVAGV